MTIEGILEAYDKLGVVEWHQRPFIQLGYSFDAATLLAGAPMLAAEVRRLRERERVLVDSVVHVTMAQVRRWFELEPDSKVMFEALMAGLESDLRAALEAVKE